MNVLRIAFCLAFLASLVGVAAPGTIAPALEAQWADGQRGEALRVLVVLRGGVDIQTPDQELDAQGVTLAERHRTVIESLRDAATSAQAGLLNDLAARQVRGDVVAYKAHWLANGITVVAAEPIVREIAARADVEVIEADLAPVLVRPVAEHSALKAVPTQNPIQSPILTEILNNYVIRRCLQRDQGPPGGPSSALIGACRGEDGWAPTIADPADCFQSACLRGPGGLWTSDGGPVNSLSTK